MRKLLFAAVAAACLALPALAAGEDHSRAIDYITCGDDTTLTAPFTTPVCAGHGDVSSVTCVSGDVLTPPLGDQRCPVTTDDDQADDSPQDLSDDEDSGDAPKSEHRHFKKPRFKAAFLNRVWRISGETNGFEAGVLDFTAARFKHLPRRWANQDDAVVGCRSSTKIRISRPTGARRGSRGSARRQRGVPVQELIPASR